MIMAADSRDRLLISQSKTKVIIRMEVSFTLLVSIEEHMLSASAVHNESDVPLFEDDEDAAWASFSTRFAEVKSSLSAIHWSSLGDKIANKVIPEWIKTLPDVSYVFLTPDCGLWPCRHEPYICLITVQLRGNSYR